MKQDILKRGVKVGERNIDPPVPPLTHKTVLSFYDVMELFTDDEENNLMQSNLPDIKRTLRRFSRLAGLHIHIASNVKFKLIMDTALSSGIIADQARYDEIMQGKPV